MSTRPLSVGPTPIMERPAFGKGGKAVTVAVNAYPVLKFPTVKVHQYDVQIGADGAKRGLINKIWHSEELQKMFGPARTTVLWDGNKLAWSAKELPFGPQMMTMIDLDADDTRVRRNPRDNKHRVIIRKSGIVPLQVVEAYLEKRTDFSNDVIVGITFLDHLLRETPSKKYVTIKRSFFQDVGASELGGGVEAWKGIFQSVRAAQGGKLLINVDVATACFWSRGSILDTAVKILRLDHIDQLITKVTNEGPKGNTMKELRRLKKVSFFCKHRKGDTDTRKKSYTVEGFESTAKDFRFELTRRTPGTEVVTKTAMSIFDYYLNIYNIRLRYPMLPLIKTKKKGEVFPMELAYICEGQRYPFKLGDRQTADMIKFTVTRPSVRADNIRDNVRQLQWEKDPILREYGMVIDPNMIKCKARVLEAPKLQYAAGSQEPVFKPRDGRWDLRGKKFMACPKTPLQSWGVMIFGSPRQTPEADVKNFIRQFITSYGSHGGQILNKDPPIMYADARKAVGTNIFELFKKAGNKVNLKPTMLCFILQQKAAQPYNDIKAYCDTQIGVVSQCFQSRHVQQAKPQYASNVAMKFNCKLGGTTNSLHKDSHALYGKSPALIIGADVSHSAPGFGSKTSYASMVGSTDLMGNRFCAVANTNGSRVELISSENMIAFVTTMLRAFRGCTQRVPERIFYFRDGVSEGEYQDVLDSELYDIKKACDLLQKAYNPKVTVVICSKRHHYRFFPVDKAAMDRNANPVPGVIIDRDITHNQRYDFYLNSHFALQGTSRPVHYEVLFDENKIPTDVLQQWIYNSCYTYARATVSVSLFPATYYAHLASSRARAHEVDRMDFHTLPSSSDTGTKRTGPELNPDGTIAPLKPLHDSLKTAMWFI